MSCCGDGRRAARAPGAWPPPARPAAPPALEAPTPLRYLGGRSVAIRGHMTGLTYVFDADGTAIGVDGRDADRLIATGTFERVG